MLIPLILKLFEWSGVSIINVIPVQMCSFLFGMVNTLGSREGGQAVQGSLSCNVTKKTAKLDLNYVYE